MMKLSGYEQFVDTRWLMEMDKPYGKRCKGFMEAQSSGDLWANLDRAPILLVDGQPIGQSKTIERYVARLVGLYGASELEAAQIDAFTEHIRDLKEMHGKAADPEVFANETLPKFLVKMEAVAGETRGCVVGRSLSLADVALYVLMCEYFPARTAYLHGKHGTDADASPQAATQDALDGTPKLAAAVAAVRSHPAVAEHLATRHYTAPW